MQNLWELENVNQKLDT